MLIGEEFSAPDEQNTSIIFKKTTPHNICIFLATVFGELRRKLVETTAPRMLCESVVLHCKKTVFSRKQRLTPLLLPHAKPVRISYPRRP